MSPDRVSLCVPINVAANANEDRYVTVPFAGEWEIEKICIVPATSVSTDGSNYRTTSFKVGSTTVASQTTNSSGGAARTAGTPLDLTLSNVGTTRLTGGTDALKIESAYTGTGAVEDCDFVIGLRQVRA